MQVIKYFGRRLTISHRSERSVSETALRFSDSSCALMFLQRTRHDSMNINVLRNILKAEGDGAALHLIDDNRVLEKLSRMLCSGRIKLHDPGSVRSRLSEKMRSADGRTEKSPSSGGGWSPKPAPRREPRPMPPPKPRPAQVTKPVPGIDTQQQVATLLAAATDGTPFCEQCEKARSGREAAQ